MAISSFCRLKDGHDSNNNISITTGSLRILSTHELVHSLLLDKSEHTVYQRLSKLEALQKGYGPKQNAKMLLQSM